MDASESGRLARTSDRNLAIRITLSGHVQGVGFRPFVYRLATARGITGKVQNRMGEVVIVACGSPSQVQRFCSELVDNAPPLANATIVRRETLQDVTFAAFDIVGSCGQSASRVFVPPDYFMCDDCKQELNNPRDRRYGYPFINCTQCGPRYTLIESLPYDRPNTSMGDFPMCADCEREYLDPADRRFHAEPIACPACGPSLTFQADGRSETEAVIDVAARHLRSGRIIAVKGIGGYHLMCDALDRTAIARLRERKRRPDKPLAVMFPVAGPDNLDIVRCYADIDPVESELLQSPRRPIVLLQKKNNTEIADNVAPGLGEIGVFLPYSPLHQLLLDSLGRPLVATSGNISGEPVLVDNDEAANRLSGIVDGFVHHDRRIVRPADDSVYRRVSGAMRPLRTGRGTAPCELEVPWQQDAPTLAVGGQMKAAIALAWDNRIVVSPHIGEMDSPRSLAVFEQVVDDLQSLYDVTAERIVCDAHAGYTTHRWAHQHGELPAYDVWHHHAHASALAAEFKLREPCMVFTWDGVGLGDDGSLWGGDALFGTPGSWQRAASFRPFRLPGGDRAGREPWRSAAALLWESGSEWDDCPDTSGLLRSAWQSNLNTPSTTAAGRLFDAAAALVLGKHKVSFEAAGPMQLEALCQQRRPPLDLPLERYADGTWRTDWAPMLPMLLDGRVDRTRRAEIFHSSLAQAILQQARAVRHDRACSIVGLCGGVFQNRILSEMAIDLLRNDGFKVYLPERLPCNDAAVCVGQAVEIAVRRGRPDAG